MGMMAMIHKANFQLMLMSNALAPMMMNKEEMTDTMACEMNILIESTSAVRLVSSLEGLAFSTKAAVCTDSLSDSFVLRSLATLSEA